jgi:hypothetical protein
VGLNLSGTQSGKDFKVGSFGAFWSTSIPNGSRQTKISLGSNTEILPGDTVEVSIEQIPSSGKAALAVTDTTPHNNVYASGGATVTEPGAASGEWMTWDPFQNKNIFAPTESNGTVSNLTMNGAATYQPITPCVQVGVWQPQCVVAGPPAIGGSQWLNAGAGWNESLLTFNQVTLTPVTFHPFVSTLVRVQLAIFPFNIANASRSLTIQVGGIQYSSGSIANLVYQSVQPVVVEGLYSTKNFINVTFSSWASTAGTVANSSRASTTLTVTEPGELEALTLAYGYKWAGYAKATITAPATSVSGTFTVPRTSFNTSLTATGTQVVGIWVGIGGDNTVTLSGNTGQFLWQAGIQIEYNGTGHNLGITPWYEYVGTHANSTGPNFDRNRYIISSGDSITVNVSITAGSQCSSRYDEFTVVDSTHQETWGGSIGYCAHPVDTSTAEWIAESPPGSSFCTNTPHCSLPVMGNVTFTNLTIDGIQVNLFGPWQAYDAGVPVTTQYGQVLQYLNTQLVASTRASSFSIAGG